MLIPLLATIALTLAQSAPAQVVAAAQRDQLVQVRATSPADSIRALRTARRAQETFEFVRRQYLPREAGVGSHRCDVRIGRWCVWNDDTNDRKPPPESPRIVQAREKLLAILDTVGARFPGDEWVAGQQVRYLIEAKRYADAVRVADRCSTTGSVYRCRAFGAVALHDSGDVAAADSAFSAALSAMPDSVRCRWTNISILLEDEIADRYQRANCARRRALENTYWRLTNPLYLRANDFRNEYLARVARMEMDMNSRTPLGSPNDDGFRETALRYGPDTWFVRDDPPAGSMSEPAVGGYREGGSGFNFVPDTRVFQSLADLSDDDWDFKLRTARTLYGPAYARRFEVLARPQISLFRRGDSALVVAAYDIRGDTLFSARGLEAGLFAVPIDSQLLGNVIGATSTDAPSRGILTTTAPWAPVIVSLELLDPKTHSAARERIGLRPPASNGRLGISDMVMFAPRSTDSLPHRLEDALALSLRSNHLGQSRIIGLFWETYGLYKEGESFEVSITISRIQEGWMRHAAERLHLATPFSPVKLLWSEVPDDRDGIASHSITLDLSKLVPGRYEIDLNVSPTEGTPLLAKREVTLHR